MLFKEITGYTVSMQRQLCCERRWKWMVLKKNGAAYFDFRSKYRLWEKDKTERLQLCTSDARLVYKNSIMTFESFKFQGTK